MEYTVAWLRITLLPSYEGHCCLDMSFSRPHNATDDLSHIQMNVDIDVLNQNISKMLFSCMYLVCFRLQLRVQRLGMR